MGCVGKDRVMWKLVRVVEGGYLRYDVSIASAGGVHPMKNASIVSSRNAKAERPCCAQVASSVQIRSHQRRPCAFGRRANSRGGVLAWPGRWSATPP